MIRLSLHLSMIRPSLWRIAYRRVAVTISDKFWKQQHQKLRGILKQQGGLLDFHSLLKRDLVDFFTTLEDVLVQNVKNPKALLAIKDRFANVTHVVRTLTKRLWDLQETLEVQANPTSAYGRIKFSLVSHLFSFVESTYRSVGDVLKVTLRVDPGLLDQTIKSLERLGFWDSAQGEKIAKKLLQKEKITYDVAGFVVNLQKMLADHFSQEALQGKDDLTEFDLHGMKVVVDESSYPDERLIKEYIRGLDLCYQLMRQKGLGKAWYGTVFLQCQGCGGTADAHFSIQQDVVRFFDPRASKEQVARLMAHELGHRYWFKQMTQEQRLKFEFLVKAPSFQLQWEKQWETPKKQMLDPQVLDMLYKELPQSAFQDYMEQVDDLINRAWDSLKGYLGIRKPKSWYQIVQEFGEEISAAGSLFLHKFPLHLSEGRMSNDQKLRDLQTELLDASEKAFKQLSNWDIHASPSNGNYPDGVTYQEIFKVHRKKWADQTKSILDELRSKAQAYATLYWNLHNYEVRQQRHENTPWQVEKFKDVPSRVAPVTWYGGMNIAEAFAEAFAHFVVGKDMSRDQIDSFKSVLGPGVRTSAKQPPLKRSWA